MRLVSFHRRGEGPQGGSPEGESRREGESRHGVARAAGVVDLARHGWGDRMRDVLAPDRLARLARAVEDAPIDHAWANIVLAPPVPDPGKIVCVGLNYLAHAAEAGRARPAQPSLFLRWAGTLVPPGGAMIHPRLSARFDYEGELALVIGRPGRHIAAADALDHVAGYACFVDGSARDFQQHSVTAGKNFPATAPFGPWLVTADEIADPSRLALVTRLNGEVVQKASTGEMIFDVPAVISYVSGIMPLETGDVIALGTPPGVGAAREPALWLKPGDVLEVEISGIGALRSRVAAE